MPPHLSNPRRGNNPKGKKTKKPVRRGRRKNLDNDTVRTPFSQTQLGKIPPEIRENIFRELLTDPPSYAGHDTVSPLPTTTSTAAAKRFVHIKRSWYHITQTCRQIYLESHPIFFAAKGYYFENVRDLARFLGPHLRRAPRWDTITALCLKDVMKEHRLFTTEQLDDLISQSNDPGDAARRRYFETMTYKTFDFDACYRVKQLKNLRTVGFCMRVGEEMLYVNLLFYLSGMSRGLVSFVDASRWLIRLQDPEDAWDIQYACFSHAAYAKGKDNEAIPYDRIYIQSDVTDIDSQAPGLREGDERYVEAQIQWPVIEKSLEEPTPRDEGDISCDSTSLSGETSQIDFDSDEARFEEVLQDELENNTQLETAESDHVVPGVEEASPVESGDDQHLDITQSDHATPGSEPGSNVIDQTSLLGSHNDDGQNTQVATNADAEENQDSSPNRGEEVSGTQMIAGTDHPIQESPSEQTTHDSPPATVSDGVLLVDVDHEDNEIQTDTRISDQAAQIPDLQPDDGDSTEEHAGESSLENLVKEKPRIRSRLRSKRGPLVLLPIYDGPSFHTEEEMERHEKWLYPTMMGDQAIARRDSRRKETAVPPPSEEVQERHVEVPVVQKMGFVAVSRQLTELILISVQTGAMFLMFLLLVKIPEQLSNVNGDRRDPEQRDVPSGLEE